MITETGMLALGGLVLAGWQAYIHIKVRDFCKTCRYTYTPLKEGDYTPIMNVK